MIQIVVLYALFASTFSLGKVLLNYAPPIFLVGIRMSIAGLILLAYQYFQGSARFKFQKSDWPLYVQAILFTCFFPYIFRFWGLKHMAASKASLLYTFGPFMTFLFSYLLNHERVTTKKILGLLIGFFGLLPVLVASAPLEDLAGGIGFLSWAEFWVIASISCLSYGWIVVRKLLNMHNYEPAMVNGISMFCGGILALTTSACFETITITGDINKFLQILTIVIVISNLLCHTIYGNLLKIYSPTLLSFAGFLTPLFAAFYGWIAPYFLNSIYGLNLSAERISPAFFLSLVCVIIGLAIFYQDELKGNISKEEKKLEEEQLTILES